MARARKDLAEKLPEEEPTDVAGMLAWIQELIDTVPPEAWEDAPTDASVNLEHYLYGHPKQQP